MTLDQFVAKYNGRPVDVDHAYGPQCWDLAEAYCEEVLNIPKAPWSLDTGDGTAYGSFNIFPAHNAQYFDKIIHQHGDHIELPKTGDLIIWTRLLPGSEGAGHVAVCLADGGANNFTSFDQNWGGQFAHRLAHDYSYVVGFLRPKSLEPRPATVPITIAAPTITSAPLPPTEPTPVTPPIQSNIVPPATATTTATLNLPTQTGTQNPIAIKSRWWQTVINWLSRLIPKIKIVRNKQ